MKVIESGLRFASNLTKRTRTTAVILHHAEASNCTVYDVHRWHLANDWAGIGYHYFVRKDGRIYRGRPENTVGAHAGSKSGYNAKSIGICFEGAYDREVMPAAQLAAGKALIRDIMSRYGKLDLLRHKDVCDTDCPGEKFPWEQIKNYNITEKDEDDMLIYKTQKDIPDWAQNTVKKLLAKGYLTGEDNGALNLEHNMLRVLVINDRAGLYQ